MATLLQPRIWLHKDDGPAPEFLPRATLEAMEQLRICRLSERVRELEKLGFLIEHERDTSLNAHFVRYKLLKVAYG